MAKKQYFENLLGAMQESILKAQKYLFVIAKQQNMISINFYRKFSE